jgi:hypothetical protein
MRVGDVGDHLEDIANKLLETGGKFISGPRIDLNPSEVAGSLEASISTMMDRGSKLR